MLLLGIWGILFFFLFDYGMAIVVLEDDCYDGNIFVVYVGNGFLVLFCLNLREFFECKLLVILVYYFDDSKDCKQYVFIVFCMQEFYGWVVSIIFVFVDSIFD